MRLFILVLLQFFVFFPLTGYASSAPKAKDALLHKAALKRSYGRLPLYFARNDGQTDKSVRFYEKGAGHSTFFTDEGVVLSLVKDKKARAVKLSFAGANKDIDVIADNPLETRVNYFTGKDQSKWRRDVPVYGSVIYKGVYKNIDVKFYGNNNKIEHDIIVKAGGNPQEVIFSYDGVESIAVADNGNLEVTLADGKLIEQKPFIYQEIGGKRVEVQGSYRIISRQGEGHASYGFNVASYDRTRELVIDPVLNYSTYIGGSASDFARDIAVDSTGAVYITGWTLSPNFPVLGPLQSFYGGGIVSGDVFVTKINPAGTAIVYSTYLGGNADEEGLAIAVDASGNAYVTGYTQSFNFPVFKAFQAVFGGGVKDAFVAKIAPAGNALVFSTYIGGLGSEKSKGIAVDAVGNVFLTGWTSSFNFPVLNAVQPLFGGIKDAFVLKMRPPGLGLVYSTFLGGTDVDGGRAITLDATGAAYVAGHSWSVNFPLKNPIQGVFGGIKDVVVFKLVPAGNALVFSTYIGGTGAEKSKGIALDSTGSIYVTGWTSSPDFPVLNPIQGALSGVQDTFVVKMAPPGRRFLYSTYLGGTDSDSGRDIAVDSTDAVYVAGHSWSSDYPLLNPLQGMFGGTRDAVITKIDSAGTNLLFSTYLGGGGDDTARGIAIDSSNAVYVAGGTTSINFPIVNPIQGTNAGLNDAFAAKIVNGGGVAVVLTTTPDAAAVTLGGTLGYTVKAVNTTPLTQCFQYWENMTLPGGIGYPSAGELFGPLTVCVNANSVKTAHLTKAIPLGAPVGTYVLNAFIGNHHPSVTTMVGFNFNVSAFAPLTGRPNRTWRLLENGFIKK